MTLYDTILLVCAVITAVGTPISIWIGVLNRRANQIQHEQTGEYREQTEIMRAQAVGAPVPARVHSLPSAFAQLSWFRRQGALPYVILAVIFAVASTSLFYAYSHAPIQSLHGTIAVAQNSHEVTVTVDANPPYEVLATPNWNTTVWPEKRDKGQFSLGFNTPAPTDAVVDWEVISIPESHVGAPSVTEQLASRDKELSSLQGQVAAFQTELNEVRDEIWIPLSTEESSGLTSSFRDAHINGLKVSVARQDTPDCARVANQVVTSLLAAGAVLPDTPYHTIDGEGLGIKVFADQQLQEKGAIIQAALSKAFRVSVALEKQQPGSATGKPVDLGIMIGLRIPQ